MTDSDSGKQSQKVWKSDKPRVQRLQTVQYVEDFTKLKKKVKADFENEAHREEG